jgi:hypothetical protein
VLLYHLQLCSCRKLTNIKTMSHTRQPTQSVPCRFFAMGTCKYGDKCRFSHSAASNTITRFTRKPNRVRQNTDVQLNASDTIPCIDISQLTPVYDSGILLSEIWCVVIPFLELREIRQLSLCNRILAQICDNDMLWQQRTQMHFPDSSIRTNSALKNATNKQIYKRLCELTN